MLKLPRSRTSLDTSLKHKNNVKVIDSVFILIRTQAQMSAHLGIYVE